MKFSLQGVIPALLTPFTRNGKHVDYDKACALADRLAGQKAHGIFPCGTTGEGPLMTVEERKKLVEELVKAVAKQLKVIAHTGAFDTATTVELTRHARDVGACAAGVVAPGFYTHDDAALYAHYRAVAKAVPSFPILLYNIPGCVKNVLKSNLVLRLFEEFENIVGVKDSGGDITALNRILAGAPQHVSVINGVDEYTYQAYLAGAKGSVSSTANVAPELFLAIFDNVKKGDLKRAWLAQTRLSEVCGVMQYGRSAAYYKEALRLRGFDAGYVRPPLLELPAGQKKRLVIGMKSAGLI